MVAHTSIASHLNGETDWGTWSVGQRLVLEWVCISALVVHTVEHAVELVVAEVGRPSVVAGPRAGVLGAAVVGLTTS